MLDRNILVSLLCAAGAMLNACGPAEGSEWATNEKPLATIQSTGHDAGKHDSGAKPADGGAKLGGDAGAQLSGDGGGSTELCGNGLDDNGNGQVDEACPCGQPTQPCYPGKPSQVGVGICQRGTQKCSKVGEFATWGACEGAVLPSDAEQCDGKDHDCDGVADNGCDCTAGQQEPCGLQVGECKAGVRVCQASGTWSDCIGGTPPGQEVCNGKDDDCNGLVDEGCPTVVSVQVDLDGDCLTATCPAQAPFPVGCNLVFAGGDERGCVASSPNNSTVYFQEGNNCGAGHVSGTLLCSNQQGAPLSESTCPINKSKKYYPADASGCPET